MKKPITDYRVTYHGVDHSQYFQGHGLAFTEYTDCATGIGSSESEALEDALESLAQNDWDLSKIYLELKDEMVNLEKMRPHQEDGLGYLLHEDCPNKGADCDHDTDLWYYVSVDVM